MEIESEYKFKLMTSWTAADIIVQDDIVKILKMPKTQTEILSQWNFDAYCWVLPSTGKKYPSLSLTLVP